MTILEPQEVLQKAVSHCIHFRSCVGTYLKDAIDFYSVPLLSENGDTLRH